MVFCCSNEMQPRQCPYNIDLRDEASPIGYVRKQQEAVAMRSRHLTDLVFASYLNLDFFTSKTDRTRFLLCVSHSVYGIFYFNRNPNRLIHHVVLVLQWCMFMSTSLVHNVVISITHTQTDLFPTQQPNETGTFSFYL